MPATLLEIMGDQVPRATLFGIPLQQEWSHSLTGDFAPTYYLETDAPLCCHSFIDAVIAEAYLALQPAQRARFDQARTRVRAWEKANLPASNRASIR